VKIDNLTLPDVIDRPRLAELLHVSPQTLRRAERAGRLIANRPNSRSVLYFRGDVMNWLAGPSDVEHKI